MKKMLLSATAIALLFASCSKKDDDKKSGNTMKINGNTYTASAVNVVSTGGMTAMAASDGTHTISISFFTTPTADGDYGIKASSGAPSDVLISTSEGGQNYVANSSSAMAAVTVSGGKIGITIPEVWAYRPLSADSIKISATLKQTN